MRACLFSYDDGILINNFYTACLFLHTAIDRLGPVRSTHFWTLPIRTYIQTASKEKAHLLIYFFFHIFNNKFIENQYYDDKKYNILIPIYCNNKNSSLRKIMVCAFLLTLCAFWRISETMKSLWYKILYLFFLPFFEQNLVIKVRKRSHIVRKFMAYTVLSSDS